MTEIMRRDFVALAALTPGLIQAAELRHFTAEDAKWIDAIMAQIIPTDKDPGAREAGCVYYLDRQLPGPLARFQIAYKTGLQTFQNKNPAFLESNPAAQIATLKTIEKTAFFEMLADHTMQAFYGSPTHGGNKNEASWKMLGIAKQMNEGHAHGK